MHLVLHLGPHKTGTTYIQRILWRNRETLTGAGWLYPDFGRPGNSAGHHDLAKRPSGQPNKAAISELRALLGTSDQVILTSEQFSRWSPDALVTLADGLGARQVSIVYYLRDPFDRFDSYWRERIKHAEHSSLPEVFAANFADPHRSPLLNPLASLRRYARLDDRFTTRIICYDPIMQAKQDICAPLWHGVLGIEDAYDVEFKRPNRSFSIEISEFLRTLLSVVDRRLGVRDPRALNNLMSRADLPPWRFGLCDEGREAEALMTTHMQPKIREQVLNRHCQFYRHLRQVLGQEFGHAIWGGVKPAEAFAGGQKSLTYYDSWDLLSEPVIRDRIELLAERVEIAARGAGNGEHALA
ncbi:MAG: hypothetical protein AAF415_13530 [Pseudomonadota bacterium]